MNAQEVVGLARERVAWRGRHSEAWGRPWRAPLMLGLPPSPAERLVYEVRQKCRNIEGESRPGSGPRLPGTSVVCPWGGQAGRLAPTGVPAAEACVLRKG